MRQNLKKLTLRHLSMIESLNLEGKSQKEVSEQFGISQTWLSLLKKDPLWLAKEAEYKQIIQQNYEIRLCQMLPKAIDAIEKALDSPKASIRLKAAEEILKKAGIDGKSSNEDKGPIFLNMVKPTWMENETVEVADCQKKDSEEKIIKES